VREAYADKGKTVEKSLNTAGLLRDSLNIYLRAFKTEKKVEVWGKNISDSAYKLVRTLPICEISGEIGPKRRSRDLQVPEGFYHISELNPFSKYYLSLKINYPNASDSIKGVRGKLGNLIYMHGGCESSGCIAVTNDYIKELYIYCVEAYNSGQHEISMTIYPSRLTDTEYKRLTTRYQKYKDEMGLWASLKESYDFFEQHHFPPMVRFMPDGSHRIN